MPKLKTQRYQVTIKNLRVQETDDSTTDFPEVVLFFDHKGISSLDYRKGDEHRFIQTRKGGRIDKIRKDKIANVVNGYVRLKDLSYRYLSYEVESVVRIM